MKNKSASRARGQRQCILHPTAISQAIAQLGQQWRVHHLKGMATVLLAPGLLALSGLAQAQTLPVGGTVSAGAATISSTAAQMNVVQSSQRAVIDWTSFSIGQGAKVEFMVPNAQGATLNRVNGNMTSEIAGQLRSNGSLFLINPNGIAITPTGVVNTGGAFVASSLDQSNADFMAARMLFNGRGTSARVSNAGSINAGQGAYVALLGGAVGNSGLINVPMGRLGLGSGEQVTLDINGNNFMQVAVPGNWLADNGALVDNSGTLQASGGVVQLKAAVLRQAVREVINMSGTINADSATRDGGRIELIGGADPQNMAGMVRVSGRLSAQATGPGGNGGFIETSGAQLDLGGISVSTQSVTGHAGHWLIDPYNITISSGTGSGTSFTGSTTSFTPGAATVINTATLQTALAASNVAITTGAAGSAGSDPGDITIVSPLSWSSATTLTLTAARNININAVVSASGGTGAGFVGTTGASGGLNFGVGGRIDLASTASFSLNGASYTVITNLGSAGSTTGTDLQGMSGNLSRNYVLGANIDASATSSWNSNAGFNPIGTAATPFTGAFNGLGHVISGLTINRTSTNNVGLFGATGAAGSIRNVGLVGGAVAGRQEVGALVGTNAGTISNAYSSASVTSVANMVGGLVGKNTGSISNSNAQTTITIGTVELAYIGGLVGLNDLGSISNSYAQGTISITATGVGYTGGLVGRNNSIISNPYTNVTINSTGDRVIFIGGLAGTNELGARISESYATGNITASGSYAGSGGIGGLVGVNYAGNAANGGSLITNSYATGNLTTSSASRVGGLVGWQQSALGFSPIISNSYARTTITINSGSVISIGGLVGDSSGAISNSYAQGAINITTGAGHIGGLAGRSFASITNSYADVDISGTVANVHRIGGLVGSNEDGARISGSFATGDITTVSNMGVIGGLVGVNYSGNAANGGSLVTNSYATGDVTAAGGNRVGGLVGWQEVAAGGNPQISNSYSVGRVTGSGTAGGLVGGNDSGAVITSSYWNTTNNSPSLLGVGAGVATGATGLSSTAFRQAASFTGWSMDSSGGQAATWRIYEGSTTPLLKAFLTPMTIDLGASYTVTYNGQAQTAPGSDPRILGSLNTAAINAGTYSTSGTGLYSTQLGYDLSTTGSGGTLTITAVPITVTANAQSVTYGTALSSLSYSVTRAGGATGLFGSDTLSGSLSTSSGTVPNVGTHVITQGTLSGAGNYILTYVGANLTVTPASLRLVGTRVYDGTTTVAGSVLTAMGVNGQTFTVLGTGAAGNLSSANAGASAQTLATVTGLSVGNSSNGGLANNYNALTVAGSAVTITPANLTLVGTRAYDGTTTVAGSVLTAMGVNGQSFTVTGAGAAGNLSSANAGASARTLATFTGLSLGSSSNGGLASNYNALSMAGSAVTITAAPITVTANAQSVTYGAALPSLTYSITRAGGATGLFGSDTLSGALSTAAGAAPNVGNYQITQGTLSGGGNYTLTYVGANLSVTPASLRLVGARVYDGTSTVAGSVLTAMGVNGQTFTVLGAGDASNLSSANAGASAQTLATLTGLNLGSSSNGGQAGNYSALSVAGSAVTISAAPITVTANAQSMTYGTAIPLLSYSITRAGGATGLFGSDTLSGALSIGAGAVPNVGTHAITQGTLSGAGNYTLTYVGANLKVNPGIASSLSSFVPLLQSKSVQQPTGADLSPSPWFLRTANEKTWPDAPVITDQLRQSKEVQWGPIASGYSDR